MYNVTAAIIVENLISWKVGSILQTAFCDTQAHACTYIYPCIVLLQHEPEIPRILFRFIIYLIQILN